MTSGDMNYTQIIKMDNVFCIIFSIMFSQFF